MPSLSLHQIFRRLKIDNVQFGKTVKKGAASCQAFAGKVGGRDERWDTFVDHGPWHAAEYAPAF